MAFYLIYKNVWHFIYIYIYIYYYSPKIPVEPFKLQLNLKSMDPYLDRFLVWFDFKNYVVSKGPKLTTLTEWSSHWIQSASLSTSSHGPRCLSPCWRMACSLSLQCSFLSAAFFYTLGYCIFAFWLMIRGGPFLTFVWMKNGVTSSVCRFWKASCYW